ncbi:DUF3347 domain-containing protein [Sphingobacterium spiritivorum]|uniref:DUF3347 domain-containing protein n=1 Tax=Sphingobacterium spiritivorum TaxID=258 RepID=UPI003DA4587C
MKRMIILVLAPLLLMACQSGTTTNKTQSADSVSSLKDTAEVSDQGTSGSVVTSYLDLGKSLYLQDQDKIIQAANTFAQVLKVQPADNTPSQDQLKDILENTTENIQHILDSKDNLIHQREHYEIISKDVYDYVKLFGTKDKLYRFDCKLDKKTWTWLSDITEVQNPYRGMDTEVCGTLTETLH